MKKSHPRYFIDLAANGHKRKPQNSGIFSANGKQKRDQLPETSPKGAGMKHASRGLLKKAVTVPTKKSGRSRSSTTGKGLLRYAK